MRVLASALAHQINNPLAAITANIDLALRETETGPALEEELRDARESARKLRAIVDDLRIFAGPIDSGAPADLRRVLEATLRIAWAELGRRAHVIAEYGDTPAVRMSEARLAHLLLDTLLAAAGSLDDVRGTELRVFTRIEDGRAIVELASAHPAACRRLELELAEIDDFEKRPDTIRLSTAINDRIR
jgi:C4-dicarboxylate-specific signal transduction histidine kinase